MANSQMITLTRKQWHELHASLKMRVVYKERTQERKVRWWICNCALVVREEIKDKFEKWTLIQGDDVSIPAQVRWQKDELPTAETDPE